jgi:hypothetical protein
MSARDGSRLLLRTAVNMVAVMVSLTLSLFSLNLFAESKQPSLAAVLPAKGPITTPELKTVVKMIRAQLRYQGDRLVLQKHVRTALQKVGAKGPPTRIQVETITTSLGASRLLIPVVAGDGDVGFELVLLLYDKKKKDTRIRAAKAKLPPRGGGIYTKKEVGPAAAATVAFLLGRHPNPVEGPFPTIQKVAPDRILGKTEPAAEKSAEPAAPADSEEASSKKVENDKYRKPQLAEPEEEKGEKRNWERWDHTGLFAEIGFMFSWCRQDGLCASPSNGYGARIRFGIRIMSYVALSITGIGVDHKMPITTNSEVFLNVESAFVYAGFFGGIRFHPVRRFIVDPFVGIDFGSLWLLYAQNEEVPIDSSIPEAYISTAESFGNKRRETIYLKGFTITPEFGFNVFITPAFAFGFHVQWLIPFWKKSCVRAYNPTVEGLKSTDQVCAEVKSIKNSETMDEEVAEKLSNKDNLPRFVSIELDLTVLFK